ncbi:MAG: hypothetical protein QXI58_03550 [Candidatus Micrarchaeia archaeon]
MRLLRVGIPLVLFFALLVFITVISKDNVEVIFSIKKIGLFSAAILLAHIFRKLIFFYLDIRESFEMVKLREIDGITFLGICCLVGLFYLACIIGFALIM